MLKKSLNKFPVLLLIFFISTLVLVVGATCFSYAINQNNNLPLKFAQISDVHYQIKGINLTRRLYSSSDKLLKDAIKQINKEQDLDFIVFSGDMINKSKESDFIKFIQVANTLIRPWYPVAGNHDIGIKGGITKAQLTNILYGMSNDFKENKLYYSFVPKKGYLIIVMDGVIDSKVTSNGYFDEKQLEWLDKLLEKNKDSNVFIFQHFPIVEPYKSKSHSIINSDEYLNILSKYKNPIIILSGHYHSTKIQRKSNIVHVSTPALVEYPNAFRIVSIQNSPEKLTLQFQFKETSLKNLQKESKSWLKSPELNYGEESDRNTTIIIDKPKTE